MIDLFAADLHLTARADDEYRWAIFDWLENQLEQFIGEGPSRLWLLGDLTEFKDNHPAALVNRVVDGVLRLTQYTEVHIVMGNHDYQLKGSPFFAFLDKFNSVHYHTEIEVYDDVLILPHTETPVKDWKGVDFHDSTLRMILMHQSVIGVKTESGHELEDGISRKLFNGVKARVLSGDIHLPQKVGNVEYVGTPYPVRFGDNYNARCLLVSNGEERDLFFPSLRKVTVNIKHPTDLFDLELDHGDMVKVVAEVSSFDDWVTFRKGVRSVAEKLGLDVKSVEAKRKKVMLRKRAVTHGKNSQSSQDVLRRFAKSNKLDSATVRSGLHLLRKAGVKS